MGLVQGHTDSPQAASRAFTKLCSAALATVPGMGTKAGLQVLKWFTF